MKLRELAAWFSGMALLGTGATLLCAQPPQAPRQGPDFGRNAQALRAQVIKLRIETEMLRFDYELEHNAVLEDVKTRRALKVAGAMMQVGSAIQSAINDASANQPVEAPRKQTEQDRKKAAEEMKKAEQEEKREEAEEAAFIAERKKELARRFALLAEKQLDLEDAERNYRETAR